MRPGTLKTTPPAIGPLISDPGLERLRMITLLHRSRCYRRFPGTDPGGVRLSHWRGQGMELHDARPYQPGDDIRHLDWRATARSGKPVTKQFVEERSRSLFLLVDRRPSMMFGTRRELKAATAARVAAILAFAALAEREPVSGLVVETGARYFPPARTLEGLLPLLRAAAAAPTAPAAGGDAAAAALPPVSQLLSHPLERGTTCCLISDFHDVIEGRADPGDYLPGPGSGSGIAGAGELVAIRIVDAAEWRLPQAGVLRLVPPGGSRPVTVDTGDPRLRRRYQEDFAERSARLHRRCDRLGIRLLTIDNRDEEFPVQLETLL